jgi:replicative DNA helicase
MDESSVKRIMPHHDDAEKAVLGSLLMDNSRISEIAEILTKDDFYQRQYGVVFETITGMDNSGLTVDFITLQSELQKQNAAPELAELGFLRDLFNAVTTSTHAKDYARIVKEDSTLRSLIREAQAVENLAYENNGQLEDILDTAEKRMFQVFEKRGTNDFVPIREVVLDTLATIEKASKTQGNVTGLATGFADLDYKTSGLQNSDLILVAARPSMGKTAFVLNIAEYMAFRKDRHVAIFSLEMSKKQLMNRLLAMESRVDSQSIRNGSMQDEEWGRLIDAASVIGGSNLIIDDTPGISIRELRTKCRKYKLEHGLDIVMIDYLQLMSGSGARGNESRQQEISEISRSLKALARELNVPIIALSQLSRAVEQRTGDHRPILSDLRESGAIEQDADVVMFLYRDDYYHKDSEMKGICEVIIAKQRNGPIGTVNLVWLPDYTKFMSVERERR